MVKKNAGKEKRVNQVRKLSATTIKVAAMCPRALILSTYLKRQPFKYESPGIGTFVHNSLKEFIEEISRKPEIIKEIKEIEKFDELRRLLNEIIYKNYHKKLPELLEKTKNDKFYITSWSTLAKFIDFFTSFLMDLKKEKEENFDIQKVFLGQEWQFKANLTDRFGKRINITGRVDLAVYNPISHKVLIWDFKSYDTNELSIDMLQLATYYVGIEAELGIKSWLSLLYTNDEGIREAEFTSRQMEKFIPQFKKFLFKIIDWQEGKEIPPLASNPEYCGLCTVKKECEYIYFSEMNEEMIKAYF